MASANPVTDHSPQFSLLSEQNLEQLHLAALEVLRVTGVRFHHQGALDMLRAAGAFITDDNLVKFPARLAEAALGSAPGRVILCDRHGEPAVFLEGRRVNFGTGSDCLNLLDPETGEHRKFTQQDLVNGYRLCDALPNIHFLMSIGLPTDVDPKLSYDVQMALMLEHSTKPIVFVTNDSASCQRAIDMAAAVAGGQEALREEQHILLFSEPSSPLQQSESALDKLLMMAEYELPVGHVAGGDPRSLVLHQLQRPGAPFIFGAGLHHMDMKSSQICYASPEFQLTKAAIAELGRWYGMPTWGYAGCSDAKVMDEQAALEAMLSVLTARLSGGNLIHDVGYMESGLTCSFEMIVLTDELVAMTDSLMCSFEVNQDSLLLDEIDRVGPGGNYLSTKQTLRRFRDFWYPDLLDRSIRSTWLKNGGVTLGERLNARVKEILKEHRPEPLETGVKRHIDEILSRAA